MMGELSPFSRIFLSFVYFSFLLLLLLFFSLLAIAAICPLQYVEKSTIFSILSSNYQPNKIQHISSLTSANFLSFTPQHLDILTS